MLVDSEMANSPALADKSAASLTGRPFELKGNIRSKYASVRARHPEIPQIPEYLLLKIEEEALSIRKGRDTQKYLAATLGALIAILSIPAFSILSYRLGTAWHSSLAKLIRPGIFSDHPFVAAWSWFFFSGVICYMLIFPSVPPRFLPLRPSLEEVDFGRSKLWLVAGVLVYVSLAVPLAALYSTGLRAESVLHYAVLIWLMLPIILLGLLPPILFLLLFLSLWPANVGRWTRQRGTAIIVGLVEFIHELDRANPPLTPQNISVSVAWIRDISKLIRRLYESDLASDAVSAWTATQMGRASDSFMALSSWLFFSGAQTVDNLTEKLSGYLTIFLSGNYDALPREPLAIDADTTVESVRRTWLRKAGNFALLICFMALPLAAYLAVGKLFRVEIPAWMQSSATILYLLWAGLGLLSFSEHLTPEGREFLSGILKSTLGKG